MKTPSTFTFPPEEDQMIKIFLEGLCTSTKCGISSAETDLKEREAIYGHNRKELIVPVTFCQLLWDALQDFTLRVLIVAAIISIAVEVSTAETESKRSISWIEGFAILVAVFVCCMVAASNDYKKQK